MVFFFFYEMLDEIGAFERIQHFVQHCKLHMLDEMFDLLKSAFMGTELTETIKHPWRLHLILMSLQMRTGWQIAKEITRLKLLLFLITLLG